MVNREITIMIAAVGAILIAAPILSIISQPSAADSIPKKKCDRVCQDFETHSKEIIGTIPTGVNMTTGSNMTGANTTGGTSIPTTHPAASGSAKELKEKLDAGIFPGPAPDVYVHHNIKPAGLNSTSTSNMTGAAGNMTGSNVTGASGIPTTHPAGAPDLSKKIEIEPPVPSSTLCVSCHEVPKTRSASPAGLNTTSTSNTTGSNATAHGTSIHTTNPAASRPIHIVHGSPGLPKVNLAGVNMTSTSNTTTTGNTSAGAHGSAIPTANPAGRAGRTASCPPGCYPFLLGCKC